MKKKIIRVLTFLFIAILGIVLIKTGLYFQKLSSPKHIYKEGIEIVSVRLEDLFKIDNKYQFGDDFKVNGSIDFNIASEEYKKKSLTDIDYKKKNNLVNNLSKMDIIYSFNQSKKDKKQYLTIDEEINNEKVLNYKYLVENSTKYYFVESVINNYIDDGNDNYFEIFTEGETTVSNLDYMYEFLKDALAEELGKNAESYTKTTTINNNQEELNQLSVRLNNKTINSIMNGILQDIKDDERANNIMKSVDSDFSKRKFDIDKLEKNESYTINIYSSKYLNKPLKYEIVYMKEDSKKIYSYEGDSNKGLFYYSENDNMKYTADVTASNKEISINVFDYHHNDAGNIKINRDINSTMMNVSLNLEKSSYDIVYSKKYKDYLSNKSYIVEQGLSMKIVKDGEIRLNGDVKKVDKIEKNAEIDVDVDKAVLMSKLSPEQKEKYDNLYDNIKRRLENE